MTFLFWLWIATLVYAVWASITIEALRATLRETFDGWNATLAAWRTETELRGPSIMTRAQITALTKALKN